MSWRFGRLTTWLCGLPFAGALTISVSASAAPDQIVDVELVLAVDVSLSMSPEELVIQRDGYASALTNPVVINAILDGVHGRVAVTYIEWAGEATQHVVVPWTMIASAADAQNFVARMTAVPPQSARRTSISAAISFSAEQFANNGFRGTKRVIDVSGDGPNNEGTPVQAARDRAVEDGITINGLPLMTHGGVMATAYDIHNLDAYYQKCVIGGPGAFMVPVNDWPQFPEAVRRKLMLELAGAESPLRAAAEIANAGVVPALGMLAVDCLVGEKTWNYQSGQ